MSPIDLQKTRKNRTATVFESIEKWNANIPELYRIVKFQKMTASPYSFFRGTNHVFWSDFVGSWRLRTYGNENTRTWIQADAHVYNMGALLNHKDEVIFGFNDFDECVISDYQYDVWRMAVSIVLVAREFKLLKWHEISEMLNVFALNYIGYLLSDNHIENDFHEVHFTKDNTSGQLQKFLDKVSSKQNREKMLDKWTVMDGQERKFNFEYRKLGRVTEEEKNNIIAAFPQYIQTLESEYKNFDASFFKIKDIARRLLAGTGSLGVNRYYVLIDGHRTDFDKEHDDIILDIKKQDSPTAYHFFEQDYMLAYNKQYQNHAQRHQEACKALSEDPDNFLGWIKLADGYYSVRERSPFKKEFPCEKLDTEKKFDKMAEQWGKILAQEHKRSARRLYPQKNFFEANVAKMVHGQETLFADLIREVAFSYANQVQEDWFYYVKNMAQKYHIYSQIESI